jgi:phage replication-related protein YjqB (UPF0714/DUF867 family)
MNDKYSDFHHLAEHEQEGRDWRIREHHAGPVLILAPHGGGIEPGTSELAEAIAGNEHSLYLFEGLKASGNRDLHITSSCFDEPRCRAMLADAETVVAVHGEDSDEQVVFIGGLDNGLAARVSAGLAAAGFVASPPNRVHLEGRAQSNICNGGRTGAGVQLEIADGLRRTFFRALTPSAERQHVTDAFRRFAAAVRTAMA